MMLTISLPQNEVHCNKNFLKTYFKGRNDAESGVFESESGGALVMRAVVPVKITKRGKLIAAVN
jgi:hypothetical protein